jgi:hypothetical protein
MGIGRMAIAVGVGVNLALAGCGGGVASETREGDVVAAVRDLQRSFASSDWKALCRGLSESARRQMKRIADGSHDGCLKDLSEAIKVINRGDPIRHVAEPQLGEVVVDGDRAAATVLLNDDRPHEAPLVEDGRWKLDSFFGTPEAAVRRLVESDARSRPFPPANGVTATTPAGDPCSDFSEAGYPAITGKCSIQITGGEVELTILTVFGDFKLADCELGYEAVVDRDARTWTTSFTLGPKDGSSDCANVVRCRGKRGAQPWKGRVRGDVGDSYGIYSYSHVMDACLTTPMGHYAGTLEVLLIASQDEFELNPKKSWRAEAVDADVGVSGLRLEGRFDIDRPTFDLLDDGG